MVRRGIQVQNDLGAGRRGLPGRAVFPDVFTDTQAHLDTGHLDHAGLFAFNKIPFFIKHLVIGQALLTILGNDLAPINDAGRVIEITIVQQRVADDRIGRARHGAADALKRLADTQPDAGPQQQVLGRIATEGKLGEHHHRCRKCTLGPGNGLDHLGGIALEVTDEGIELGHHNIEGHRVQSDLC